MPYLQRRGNGRLPWPGFHLKGSRLIAPLPFASLFSATMGLVPVGVRKSGQASGCRIPAAAGVPPSTLRYGGVAVVLLCTPLVTGQKGFSGGLPFTPTGGASQSPELLAPRSARRRLGPKVDVHRAISVRLKSWRLGRAARPSSIPNRRMRGAVVDRS
jgi:hypothetical protein